MRFIRRRAGNRDVQEMAGLFIPLDDATLHPGRHRGEAEGRRYVKEWCFGVDLPRGALFQSGRYP
jgi:hypothetical protein